MDTAKVTGHELDTGNEGGVFISLPFQATADGTGALVTIIAT